MSAVDKVRAEYAKKLAEAEREDEFRTILPPWRSIHLGSPLYGTIGSVSYGDPYSDRGTVSWDRAVELIEALPPVAKVMVRDSCLSFQPLPFVEALPEAEKGHWKSETNVAGVTLTIDALRGPQLSLEWVTSTPKGMLRVSVAMGFPPRGIVQYRVKRIENFGGFRYERPTVGIEGDAVTIHDDEGEALALLESPIVWASGGLEYPSRVTLYWVDLGVDLDPAYVGQAIVKQLAAIAKKGANP